MHGKHCSLPKRKLPSVQRSSMNWRSVLQENIPFHCEVHESTTMRAMCLNLVTPIILTARIHSLTCFSINDEMVDYISLRMKQARWSFSYMFILLCIRLIWITQNQILIWNSFIDILILFKIYLHAFYSIPFLPQFITQCITYSSQL